MAQPRVMLYALTTCSHCRNAKKLLDENDIAYDILEVDLTQGDERTAAIDAVKKYNPSCTFPTLLIGEKVIVGYRENEIKEALGI
ncbi:glutaredoxin [Desulfocarbo indianensis]|nr:glutaredoxin [Desulfocarbo indianensis]